MPTPREGFTFFTTPAQAGKGFSEKLPNHEPPAQKDDPKRSQRSGTLSIISHFIPYA
jgi:hypothetical protein